MAQSEPNGDIHCPDCGRRLDESQEDSGELDKARERKERLWRKCEKMKPVYDDRILFSTLTNDETPDERTTDET